jgi:hypothetical protein
MYYRRMDVALLAQVSGFFQWRIRRHLKPAVFKKLNSKQLGRYAEALGLEASILNHLPELPLHDTDSSK